MQISNHIYMDTTEYDGINGAIAESASDCVLENIETLPSDLLNGTDIMAKLNADIKELYTLTEKHFYHSSQVLPAALTKTRDSFISVDEAATDGIYYVGGKR